MEPPIRPEKSEDLQTQFLWQSRKAACLGEVAKTIALGRPFLETLYLIAQSVASEIGYKGVTIWQMSGDGEAPLMEVAYGLGIDYVGAINREVRGPWHARPFPTREAILIGKPVLCENIYEVQGFDIEMAALGGYAAMIALPLISKGQAIGALGCYMPVVHVFSPHEIDVLSAIADLVAGVVQNARTCEAERLAAVVEERECIGDDLHDWVIQAIYAKSLEIESCLEQVDCDHDLAKPMLASAVKALSELRSDIRSYVLDLRSQGVASFDLPDRLAQVVREFSVSSNAEVEMIIDEDVVAGLSYNEVYNLVTIAREALANISKHARANQVKISLGNMDGTIALTIEDNGIGFELDAVEHCRGIGLTSMRARAKRMQAHLDLTSGPNKGTRLIVLLPRTLPNLPYAPMWGSALRETMPDVDASGT